MLNSSSIVALAYNYMLTERTMQLIELKKDEIIVGFNDLSRLFDAVAYFQPVTVANYAKSKGVSVQSVYKRIKRNTVAHFQIDGVVFIID